MNDYFGLIISILLVVDALQFFMNKGRIVERSRNKYTEASFTVYRKVFGSVLLIAAVACFISSMGALGFINMGENFKESNLYLILELVVLVVIIIGLIICRKVILKPADNAGGNTGNKNGKDEEEDY